MKALLIFAHILILGGSSPALGADPVDLRGLSAAIENAKFDEKSSSISLDFVLKNFSREEIRIAERWNSWGAYQWNVLLTREDYTPINYTNPQRFWTRNFLTTVAIKPGGEHRMFCRLLFREPDKYKKGEEIFVSKNEAKRFSLPLKLVGTFSAEELDGEYKDRTNWAGRIEAPEVLLTKTTL